MNFEYYYNNVPNIGQVRNNLVYTSLISKDKKVFVKWYHNDTDYHMGKNQVVDPELMDAKFHRELHYLYNMQHHNPDMVPKILEVNIPEKKIYLEVDGVDFWEQAGCLTENYSKVLPDWEDQMLNIISAHKDRGWYKYSLHPSSYFVVDGKLKSINYFFTYHKDEPLVTLEEHRSHISTERQLKMEPVMQMLGLDWKSKVAFDKLQSLCFESFKSNYPSGFIERAKRIYAN